MVSAHPEADAAVFGAHAADLIYIAPFAGLLLSIALFPLVAPHAWERHFGKISAAWTACFVIPFALVQGWHEAGRELVHAVALDYVPFILLVSSLFVVAGGIRLVGNLVGDPKTNTAMLLAGTLLASVLGTTGAAMLLIRPLIRANEARRHRAHVFVFFIFLVANIGGSLTPLGDPPLFLGFLRGVDFFWTTQAMLPAASLCSAILLPLFFILDTFAWRRDRAAFPQSHVPRQLRVDGLHNGFYLLAIVAMVLASGLWRSGIEIPVGFGITVPLEGLVRDVVLLVVAVLSWRTTPRRVRIENAFTWIPIREVAVLFLAIFITIVPVLAVLRAGPSGPAGPLLANVIQAGGAPVDWAFFWLTGLLSSFLDNAPTYLVFFNLAGGDPATLMGPLHRTLLAISMGAVFMGANSYLGNAPNFMVRAICEEQGIRMPSFFGYLLWSSLILLPLFGIVTAVFLR